MKYLEYAFSVQDFKNLREFVNFYANKDSRTELNGVDALVMVSQILLSEDEKAYIFVKHSAYGEARDCKSLEKDILKEDFSVTLEKTKLISNENLCITSLKLANQMFLCALIVIKINVIEDMKFRLTQYEKFHRKMKKKFWPHPRIIKLYTIYILGTDKESFMEDLEFQENQVKIMIPGCHALIHGLVLDYGHQSEEKYHQKSLIELAVRGLHDYFKNNSYARNYILDLYKSNFAKPFMKKIKIASKILFDEIGK